MNAQPKKLAVFDCDGTLVDGQASICEAMEAGFAAADLPAPPRTDIRRIVGLSLPQALRLLAPDASEAQLQHAVGTFKSTFRQNRMEGRVQEPLYEGIADLLSALHQEGWTLAVATGKSDRGLTACLVEHGLEALFTSLQTADRHPSKPHPAMLIAAMQEADASAENTVMIGDTSFDMEMAKSANTRAIGVDWGYHEAHELTGSGAEIVVSTMQQLGEVLRNG